MAFSFWLVTAVLILLYVWTLTESVPIVMNVREGQCTAVLRERSSEIPCPGLEDGEVGVYLTSTSLAQKLLFRPLDLAAPGAAWEEISLIEEGRVNTLTQGEGRSIIPGTAVSWPAPDSLSYTIQARVRRPDGEHAGLLLFQPESNDGWLFQIDSENRQSVWRHWQDGRPGAAIAGVPYQKPLLAQWQSLLRQVIATFLGALGTILVIAVVKRISVPVSQRVSFSVFQKIRHPTSDIRHRLISNSALLIILAVFALSLWIADDVLERIPHVQDSITYLFQAQTLAGGALWAPEPPLAEAFVQEFLTVWNGKWFGQYPPGYPAVLAIGVLAGAPWLVNPWLAALATVLLIKLGTLLYRPSTGLLAGGLALISPFFIFLSGSLMVHAAELFWTLLTMVSWTLALRPPQRMHWAVLAGVALGMLLLTRQITAVTAGVSYVALTILVETWALRETARQRWQRALGRQVGGMLVGALPFTLLLLGYQAALTGSPWQDPRLLSRPFDLPGFGTHIGESENAFELQAMEEGMAVNWYTDPQQPPRGHSLARGLYNTEQNLESLASQLFGWYPLIALAFCWVPFLLGRPRRYDWLLLAVLLATAAIYVAYWTKGIMYGPRYYYAALPALLLLTARGLQTLMNRFGAGPTLAVFGTIVTLTILFYWPGALSSLRGYNFIGGEERRLVEEQIKEEALVFIPVMDWWDYGRFFSGNTPWLDGRVIYVHDLGPSQNACMQQAYPDRAAYLWHDDTKSVTAVPTGETICRPDG